MSKIHAKLNEAINKGVDMIDIKNELEDIIPTYDADVDVVGLLKDSTSLGTDDDGNEIPGYIFAKDIADMLELPEIELAKFALKNGYEILSAKIVGEELPSKMLVICRKGFDQDILKTDYKEIFDLELEIDNITDVTNESEPLKEEYYYNDKQENDFQLLVSDIWSKYSNVHRKTICNLVYNVKRDLGLKETDVDRYKLRKIVEQSLADGSYNDYLDTGYLSYLQINESELKEDELTEKLTNESIKPAIDWLNSIYFGLEDTKDDDNWFFSCWSHAAHFGSSWPSGQLVMAIQIDNDVEHIHIGRGDIETSEEFDYAVNSLKDKLRKKTGEKNDDISITETVGGKSKGMSVEDIANKHNVSVKQIEDQIKKGIKVEKEHTDSISTATRIAKDHLVEIPDYYDRLSTMEKDANIKRESLKDDKKELDYLLRKEEIAGLDKEERMRLHLLIQKYGRPDNELDEAIEEKTSKEIQDKIDSIVNKQIPDIEERIKKYETEKASSKDENRNRTLNNKIRKAENQIKELQKRKETLEVDLIIKKEAEEKKIRDEVDEKIKQQITPGKGRRPVHKKLIPTSEQKEAYKDIVKFLQDNAVSIRLEVAEKKVNTIRNVIPGIQDNQFKVISGVGDSGYDKKWGISGVITVKNIELLPDNLRHEFFKGGNTITEIVPIASILNSGFDELEDKITLYDEDGKSYKEDTAVKENKDNELRARARQHKKTDKKGARGWFVNINAGNVEQNIARANHMMGDGSSASNVTVGSAPAGLGEDIELSEMLPHEDESKTDFVARFMSDDKMIKEYENPKQRYAVAMSYWEKK